MEAYLLLEAARSDRTISCMWKDLTYEIIHRNTLTLQLNRLFFENSENDLRAANELVGHVRVTIRQNGYSAVREHAIQEVYSPSFHRSRGKHHFFPRFSDIHDPFMALQIQCRPNHPALMSP